jgi:hypothetical protein
MAEMRFTVPLVLLFIVSALAGCGEEAGVRVYETTQPAAYRWPEAEARTDEYEADGVTWAWDVPAGFVDAPEVPDQLVADYRFKSNNPDLPGRLTVSMIRGEAGGIMANAQRWRNQLFLTETKGMGPGDFVSQPFRSGNLELTIVRLSGQYRGPYVPTDILGAIIQVRSPEGRVAQSWFFKMAGDRETIEDNTHLFPRIYTSFRLAGVETPELPVELVEPADPRVPTGDEFEDEDEEEGADASRPAEEAQPEQPAEDADTEGEDP